MENDCVVCLMYIMSVRMQKGSSIIAYMNWDKESKECIYSRLMEYFCDLFQFCFVYLFWVWSSFLC